MAAGHVPSSLRFDQRTEDRLKAFNELTGEAVSAQIRRYVTEGLEASFTPEAIQELLNTRLEGIKKLIYAATGRRVTITVTLEPPTDG